MGEETRQANGNLISHSILTHAKSGKEKLALISETENFFD